MWPVSIGRMDRPSISGAIHGGGAVGRAAKGLRDEGWGNSAPGGVKEYVAAAWRGGDHS